MRTFLIRQWFLVGIIAVITLGLISGRLTGSDSNFTAIIHHLHAGWFTAAILFLMSITLDSKKLVGSVRKPGPVIWAILVNMAILPLIAMYVMALQLRTDLAFGLMIAISAPSTMATASVFTRQAKGNDAVSLLVTLLTNGLCVLVTPFWLTLAATPELNLDSNTIHNLIIRLLWTALLPSAAGQLLRLVPAISKMVDPKKAAFGTIAQFGILTLVFRSVFLNADRLLPTNNGPEMIIAMVWVWIACVLLHLIGLALGWWGGIHFGFQREDRIAVSFSASQKTLPIAVFLASDPELFGVHELDLAVFPILVFHASQLIIDTFLIHRFTRTKQSPNEPNSSAL